jgi:peptidoglycan/LPS O-acetylase OafA/YrhL
MGTVLIIMFGSPTTHITRLLSKNVLVGIGLISYSAYLIHQPIFAFTRLYIKSINLSAALSAFLILISFGIAYLSWRYIENPIRSRLVLSRKKP